MNFVIAIVLISLYLYFKGKNKNSNYTCRHCKKKFQYNSVYCPVCKLDDNGLTIERKEINELKEQLSDLNNKFIRLGELAEHFKRNKH